MVRKIAISEGVPADAFKTNGLVNKKIEFDDKYLDKFNTAVEKAKSFLATNKMQSNDKKDNY